MTAMSLAAARQDAHHAVVIWVLAVVLVVVGVAGVVLPELCSRPFLEPF
jgi:uncharacterized membrane protein YbaN (DUF454 family)